MSASRRPGGPDLIVVGASARAFACSAARAGWSVHAADLFGDADLRVIARNTVATGTIDRRYPESLLTAVAGFPPAACCYTGAIENHPDVIAALARDRPLFGTSAAAARAVRDHRRLAEVVRGAGIGFPETVADPFAVPRDGTFLVKPRASAGGRGIAVWNDSNCSADHGIHVWQRRVAGEPWGVAFVIDRDGHARLWGASRQLVGLDWCHARPFAYCGSLDVPLPTLGASLRSQCDRLGLALANAFGGAGLVGLIGVDLIVDSDGLVHVIELNPRPTASMELIERATGESLAAVHLAACGAEPLVASSTHQPSAHWGKVVLFAAHDIVMKEGSVSAMQSACRPLSAGERGWPELADIPCPGTSIPAGAPLLTIFAAGDSPTDVLDRLRRRAAAVDASVSAG